MWKKCLECIDELLNILFEHSNIFIGENIAEDSENLAINDQVCRLSFLYFFLWQIMGSMDYKFLNYHSE